MTDAVPAWLAQALPRARPVHAALAAAKLGGAGLVGKSGFRLTSAAFGHGEELDPCFTADEEDAVAPPLEWTAPPPGAMELVLVVEDPDAPGGQPACHWLVWGLAAQQGKLMEGEVPPRVGKNSKRNSEWLPPEPPHEDEAHDYVFQLFALDLPLILMPGATRDDLMKSMDGHVVGIAILSGSYARADEDEEWDDEDID
jgi:Raf kinase inhibitor-like YbhB/YbcL family protein